MDLLKDEERQKAKKRAMVFRYGHRIGAVEV